MAFMAKLGFPASRQLKTGRAILHGKKTTKPRRNRAEFWGEQAG